MKPAIFLDRDGTVNVEKNYLYRFEDWEWMPGALSSIRQFNQLRFLVVVVSNQAGIARGLYTEHDVDRLHAQVKQAAVNEGARIDGFYFCPHHPDYGDRVKCDCRKPEPGLLLRARRDLAIDLEASFLVGDKATDIQTARVAGVQPILVLTGYGLAERELVDPTVPTALNVGKTVEIVSRTIARKSAEIPFPAGIR